MARANFIIALVIMIVIGRVGAAWFDAQTSRAPGCGGQVTFDVRIVDVARHVDSTSPHVRVMARVDTAAPVCLHEARTLRLSWPVSDNLPVVGERWRVRSKVRAPWGMANPGGFDYARWLLANGIHGTGFVTQAEHLRRAEPGALHEARTAIADVLGRHTHAALLIALALGNGDSLAADIWERLRRTGTVHLVVVSGLHVSVAVTVGYVLVAGLLRLLPGLLLHVSARACATVGGLVGAFAYTALSGFAVPSTRAFIMAVFVGIAVLARRRLSNFLLLGSALATVLAFFPLSIFASGFWLSFGAVGALLLAFSQRKNVARRLRRLRELLRVQWLLGACMAAYTGFWVGAVSSVGLLANLVLVPFVTVFLVPTLLIAVFVLPFGEMLSGTLIAFVDRGVGLLQQILLTLSESPLYLTGRRDVCTWTAAIAGGVLWLTPLRWQERLFASLLILLIAAPAPVRMPHGEFRLTVLDVGQGSAALVETRHHTLLMDAGPRFPSGFDTGRGVVLPFVAGLSHRQIDTVIASHLDVDHAGGIPSVLRAHPGTAFFSPEAVSYAPSRNCLTSLALVRDGVKFRLLMTSALTAAQSDNDRSCTLHVKSRTGSALIMGDTSARFETLLARQVPPSLDVLVAPHHGSASSSSKAFVRRTGARHAFISAGRSNRYNHPSAEVVRRYVESGTQVWTTSEYGALSWRSDRPDEVTTWR